MASSFSRKILNFEKLRDALSKDGCGYFVSEHPLLPMEKVKLANEGLSNIPTDKMQILFNKVSSEFLQTESMERASSSMGSGPSPIYSSRNGRKYMELNKQIRYLQREELSAYNDLRIVAEDIMGELCLLFRSTYKIGEWSLIRSVGVCREQVAHCDAPPDDVDINYPDISMICALSNPAVLNVYRGTHGIAREGSRDIKKYEESFVRVQIPNGYFILFRQDLPHCGLASMGFGQRMFFAFQWNGLKGKRKRASGKTYVLLN